MRIKTPVGHICVFSKMSSFSKSMGTPFQFLLKEVSLTEMLILLIICWSKSHLGFSRGNSGQGFPILLQNHSAFSKKTFGSPQLCNGPFLRFLLQGIVICAYAVSAQKREIHWALLPTSPCSHIMWLQQNAVDNVRPFSARAASSRLRVSRDVWPISKDAMRMLRNRNHEVKMWQKLDLFWTSNSGLGEYWPLPSENQ